MVGGVVCNRSLIAANGPPSHQNQLGAEHKPGRERSGLRDLVQIGTLLFRHIDRFGSEKAHREDALLVVIVILRQATSECTLPGSEARLGQMSFRSFTISRNLHYGA